MQNELSRSIRELKSQLRNKELKDAIENFKIKTVELIVSFLCLISIIFLDIVISFMLYMCRFPKRQLRILKHTVKFLMHQ